MSRLLTLSIFVIELFGIVGFILVSGAAPRSEFWGYSLFSIVFCGLQVVLLLFGSKLSIVSFPFAYILITLLFSNAAFLLYVLYGADGLLYLRVVDYPHLAETVPLVALAFVSFGIGVLLDSGVYGGRPNFCFQIARARYSGHARTLKLLSYLAIAASLIIVFAATVQGGALSVAFMEGYRGFSDARKEGVTSVFVTAAFNWFLPWATIILIALHSKSLVATRRMLPLVAIVVLLTFASGDRTAPLSVLLVYLIVHSRVNPGFRLYKFAIVAGMLTLAVPFIQVLRMIPIADWDVHSLLDLALNLSSYSEKWNGMLVQAIFGPYSPAIMNFMATLMQIDRLDDYRLGMDYLTSLGVVVPFGGHFTPDNSTWIKDFLFPGAVAGPGFMAMAEAYLNFSILGIVMLYCLLGWVLTRFWRCATTGRIGPVELAFVFVIFYSLIVWTRNEFSFVVRCVAWSWIFIFPLPSLINLVAPVRKRNRRPSLGNDSSSTRIQGPAYK